MTDELFQIGLIVMVASFTQGMAGFGLALVSMPLLISLVGIQVAAPLVALVGIFSPALIAWRYRQQIARDVLKYPAIGSLLGIPVGVIALDIVSENTITLLLGMLIVGYVVYSFWRPNFALDDSLYWDYGFGFVGGVLTGAYNTGGPALVIFGTARGWPPKPFKANLQILLLLHSAGVFISHIVSSHYTDEVVRAIPIALVAAGIGTGIGLLLDRFVDVVLFRKLVLVLLFVLGTALIAM